MVISTVLRKKFVEMDLLDQSEAYKVLRSIQMIMLGMRTPDLEFIALNDFDGVKASDFFRAQELLHGKSIMDICLSDPQSIRQALNTTEFDQEMLQGSIMETICVGDPIRCETFVEIDFFPTIKLF